MSLPKAVEEAARAADEAMSVFEAGTEDTAAQATSLDTVVDDASSQTSPAPAADADTETPAVETPEPAAAVDAKELEKYKQRYNTLLGKYNAEVPRLARDLEFMRGQLEALKSTPAQQAPREPEQASGDGAKAHLRFLKDDEVKDFGDEVLDLHSRLARGVAESVAADVLAVIGPRLEALENSAASRVEQDNSVRLWSRVEKAFPGAKQINDTDPLWAEFLDGVEPLSGKTYRDIGSVAFDAADVGRIVSLFQAYADSGLGGVAPAGEPAPRAKPPVKPASTAGQSPVAQPRQAPTIRSADVTAFYDDLARGRYRGREEEAAKKELVILEAAQAGRIV
jgi:hypothetical protein